MIKSITLYAFLALVLNSRSLELQAQTLLYSEDFDSLPINGSCTSLGGSTGFPFSTPVLPAQWCWNNVNTTFNSAPNSHHTETPLNSDTVIFETASFSTVGKDLVKLSFYHKCLLYGSMVGEIEVSNDNGATWHRAFGSQYQGQSTSFPTLAFFNVSSYPSDPAIWGTLNSPLPASSAQWMKEEFNISTIAGGANGYPNVKIRFVYRSIQGNTLPLSNWNQFDGWFIDDIEVVAYCESTPPDIAFTSSANHGLMQLNPPQGGIVELNPKVRVVASDSSGIESSLFIYSLNNAADDTMIMTSFHNSPDFGYWSYQFPSGMLNVGDSVSYYMVVRDRTLCNYNVSRLPSNFGSRMAFHIITPPIKCGTFVPVYPILIDNFPWVEDFESNSWSSGTGNGDVGIAHRGVFADFPLGNWGVSPSQYAFGMGWSVRTGAHPTTQTGPMGDHTLGGQGTYIYMETSQSSHPFSTQLITPCLDLSTMNGCISFEFFYHKYGSTMGNLRVDVDTGTNFLSWWSNYSNFPGQTHANQLDPWEKGYVDLTPFAGKIVKLRLIGFYSGAFGDMALDDFHVFEPEPIDVELVSLKAPLDGNCPYSNAEDVVIRLRNRGCQTLNAVPVAFELNGVIFRDTVYGTFNTGDDTTYVLIPKADLSANQTHTVRVFAEMPGDLNTTNDTIGPRLIHHALAFQISSNVSICQGDSAFLHGGYQSVPGTYIDTIQFAGSCDSILSINLSVINSVNSAENVEICSGDSVFLQGSYRSTAGVYTDTLSSTISGCDSIHTVSLLIQPANTSTSSLSICAGDSVFLQGGYRSTPGTYLDLFTSSVSFCDSLHISLLTIQSIDTALVWQNGVLTASANNASYRWINCSQGSYIQGANAQSFTPLNNGIYAVEITDGNCTDTSNCFAINNIGVRESGIVGLSYSPNPVNDILFIDLGKVYQESAATLVGLGGEQVLMEEFRGVSHFKLNISHIKASTYFLDISADGSHEIIKLIKQ